MGICTSSLPHERTHAARHCRVHNGAAGAAGGVVTAWQRDASTAGIHHHHHQCTACAAAGKAHAHRPVVRAQRVREHDGSALRASHFSDNTFDGRVTRLDAPPRHTHRATTSPAPCLRLDLSPLRLHAHHAGVLARAAPPPPIDTSPLPSPLPAHASPPPTALSALLRTLVRHGEHAEAARRVFGAGGCVWPAGVHQDSSDDGFDDDDDGDDDYSASSGGDHGAECECACVLHGTPRFAGAVDASDECSDDEGSDGGDHGGAADSSDVVRRTDSGGSASDRADASGGSGGSAPVQRAVAASDV